jgi:hypothetical protein
LLPRRLLILLGCLSSGLLLNAAPAVGDVPAPTFTVYSLTTPAAILSAGQTDPTSVAKALLSSIPGGGLDFRQAVEAVSGDASSGVEAKLACPTPSSPAAAFSYRSVKVLNGHRAQVIFCPSRVISTTSPLPNVNDPHFLRALAKFEADPLRSGPEWIGDTYRYNLFVACPAQPEGQTPRTRFRYDRRDGTVRVAFDGSGFEKYCDLVGENSEGIAVQVARQDGRFHSIGRSVLHIDGLREVLGYNYYAPASYWREGATVPGVGQLCHRAARVRMRVVVTDNFVPKHSQTFQRLGQFGFKDGSGMHGASVRHVSRVETVCGARATRVHSHSTTYVSRSRTERGRPIRANRAAFDPSDGGCMLNALWYTGPYVQGDVGGGQVRGAHTLTFQASAAEVLNGGPPDDPASNCDPDGSRTDQVWEVMANDKGKIVRNSPVLNLITHSNAALPETSFTLRLYKPYTCKRGPGVRFWGIRTRVIGKYKGKRKTNGLTLPEGGFVGYGKLC